jgi:hypothetical protein
MKSLLAIIFIFLLASPFSQASEAKTPDEFVAAFRAGFQEKDPKKLDEITYSVGMSEADKQQATRVQKMIFTDQEIESVTLEPLPDDFESVFILRGQKIEPTHQPVGLVHIKYKNHPNGTQSTSCAYAVVDGKYYLVGTKSTDLGWTGPPDKTIGFMVMGAGQNDVKIRVKWNASGVDQEKAFEKPSSSFVGQYIQSITVTSIKDETDVTLTVLDSGKPIYTSEPLKGKGTLEYKKEDR